MSMPRTAKVPAHRDPDVELCSGTGTPARVGMGDIVLYHNIGGYDRPAMVAHVHPDGNLELTVFHLAGPAQKHNVPPGRAPGCWSPRDV